MSNHSEAYGSRDQRREKYTQGKEFEDGTLETLESIISAVEDETLSKDYQPLIVFFQRGFGAQLVQTWSYYAQVNNHGKFSKTTSLLTKTLRVLSSDTSTVTIGSGLIRLILTDYTKVLYRGNCHSVNSIYRFLYGRFVGQLITLSKIYIISWSCKGKAMYKIDQELY